MSALPRLSDLDHAGLRRAYAPPSTPWLRLNFVATVDGSTQGADGLSNSLNDDADDRVFAVLRELADVVVVGAGTIREEEYAPMSTPLVVVTRSGALPPSLAEGDLSQVYVATGADAEHLRRTRDRLGGGNLLVLGDDEPDLGSLRQELIGRGFADILCEGGPALAGKMVGAGLVDELCLTIAPVLVAGEGLRVLTGGPVESRVRLAGLLAADSTLLTRWFVG